MVPIVYRTLELADGGAWATRSTARSAVPRVRSPRLSQLFSVVRATGQPAVSWGAPDRTGSSRHQVLVGEEGVPGHRCGPRHRGGCRCVGEHRFGVLGYSAAGLMPWQPHWWRTSAFWACRGGRNGPPDAPEAATHYPVRTYACFAGPEKDRGCRMALGPQASLCIWRRARSAPSSPAISRLGTGNCARRPGGARPP